MVLQDDSPVGGPADGPSVVVLLLYSRYSVSRCPVDDLPVGDSDDYPL